MKRNKREHTTGLDGIIREITEQQQNEEAVKRERILLRTLIDHLPDTIYVKDADGRKVISNPADLLILGYDSEAEVIGKTDLEMFDEHTGMRGYTDDMAILRGEIPVINHEENFIDRQGNERWLYTTKMPLFDGSGNIVGLIGIGRDITERRKSEIQLALQSEKLKKLNATKDKFFSIIAHDLRSPFNAFLGLTKIMEEEFSAMTPDEMYKFIEAMGVSASNLYRLLENLLEWSLLQRDLSIAHPVALSIKSRVQESMELVKEAADEKGISLTTLIPDSLTVYADEKMLDGILRNLSSNAVKFTPPGGLITVEAKSIGNEQVQIAVRDTGIGMTKAIVDDLFKLDINTKRQGTEGEPSSGLGLILCKEFVERNGGRLWAESEEGKGTSFYFTLPEKIQP